MSKIVFENNDSNSDGPFDDSDPTYLMKDSDKIQDDFFSTREGKVGVKKKTDSEKKSNIFQGRTEAAISSRNLPDWDIVPFNQFINPRIKKI